ncbi:MAG: hypothetical protein GX446_14910 [Chthonomonadales bacterium]|nr:hypothetical protein [Chthonomonadales bacterium]
MNTAAPPPPIYTYTISQNGTPESYDEAMAVACLQGIANRRTPSVYILSRANARPAYWQEALSRPGGWMHGREVRPLADISALRDLVGRRVRGAVIWDPAVPATINLATTIAGVEDGVVLSPEWAERYLEPWKLRVLSDLRGMFTGKETGSAKNDAVRWLIREYLAKGKCSSRLFCLYEDAYATRARGDIGYVLTRDWAVKNRAFTFDLSPWGDEKPGDDPDQPLGTDLATYTMLLEEMLGQSGGKHMTEMAGFFAFQKYSNMPGHPSKHDPVPTEWETVWLISPYNCYQNTVASDCFNQSFHSHAPRKPLQQRRVTPSVAAQAKTYLCILMADYDSATPLYDFLPKHWDDPARGRIPLCWGINPNLLETYPDIIRHVYETASPNDTFAADASAAGYMNPNRIRPEYLPLFVRHNRAFYREADMTMSPMVLDWDQPTPAVKDAFAQFSPDGFATIVMDLHGTGGQLPETHVWKGMPVTELINDACNFAGVEQTAEIMARAIQTRRSQTPSFHFFRIVWTSPSQVEATIERLKAIRPELNVEVVDPTTWFRLVRESAKSRPMSATP